MILPSNQTHLISLLYHSELFYHAADACLIFLMMHLQWVNDLHALISPPAKGTPITLVLLGKVLYYSSLFTMNPSVSE
jgi:hypothetical protein